MDSRIREAALHAAAKLALGVLAVPMLGGCGGLTEAESGADRSGTRESEGGDAPDSGGGLACVAPVELVPNGWEQTADFTAAEHACCVDYVVANTPAEVTGFPAEIPSRLRTDESYGNCCRVVIAGLDVGMTGRISFADEDLSVRNACCYTGLTGLDESEAFSHAFCTPWGPTVPPSMDYGLAGAA